MKGEGGIETSLCTLASEAVVRASKAGLLYAAPSHRVHHPSEVAGTIDECLILRGSASSPVSTVPGAGCVSAESSALESAAAWPLMSDSRAQKQSCGGGRHKQIGSNGHRISVGEAHLYLEA
jgi:hypothetical protein